MLRVTEYRLIREYSNELEMAVNRAIANDWEPLGAPFHVKGNADLVMVQAMVKRA